MRAPAAALVAVAAVAAGEPARRWRAHPGESSTMRVRYTLIRRSDADACDEAKRVGF